MQPPFLNHYPNPDLALCLGTKVSPSENFPSRYPVACNGGRGGGAQSAQVEERRTERGDVGQEVMAHNMPPEGVRVWGETALEDFISRQEHQKYMNE
eukprot:757687-Hanusia_phi.AAC.2